MTMREKRHRLPKEYYTGEVSVAFTLCLKKNAPGINNKVDINDISVAAGFSLRPKDALLQDPEMESLFKDTLASATTKASCIVPVYCLMPDHQHIIITGISGDADVWSAIVRYKQKTGFWLSRKRPNIKWQKDFYDHIIRSNEDIAMQVRYILDNPVRKGLAASWQDYPCKGSIGIDLEDVLNGII